MKIAARVNKRNLVLSLSDGIAQVFGCALTLLVLFLC